MTEQQSQAEDSQANRNEQIAPQPEDDECQYVHEYCERKGQSGTA